MKVERDDIVELLFNGTKEQMEGLRCPDCGSSISYRYADSCEAFTVICKCTEDRCHGAPHEPDCVQYFGADHTF